MESDSITIIVEPHQIIKQYITKLHTKIHQHLSLEQTQHLKATNIIPVIYYSVS
jgi:flagellar assembly factor FliW